MKHLKKMLLIGILAIIILISSCSRQDQASPNKEAQTLKGVSLSPKSFASEDFTNFFEKAKQSGSIVSWAGDWNELSNVQNGGPAVVAGLASKYKYTPLIIAQFFTQSSGQLIRPLDDATKQKYKASAVSFAEKYKPEYLGLGIEVNMLYEKSPDEFEVFVDFYNEVYDAVKAASPKTKVFTIFQLERMKGLNGGLFGGVNDPKKQQWSLLEKFRSDIIAFTTYPGLVYKNPSEIPQDYYTEIKSHATKPIAFTEIGWHSDAGPKGWESSEKEQSEFIERFFSLTKGMNIRLAVWSFMYDQDTIEPFKSMGLIYKDGMEKLAWEKWTTQN